MPKKFTVSGHDLAMLAMAIGQRLRDVRGGMPQTAFAESLGMHKNTLAGYERGARMPTADVVAKVCAEYELSPTWLLYGRGPMKADILVEPIQDGAAEDDSSPYGLAPGFVRIPLVRARLSAGNGSLETEGEVQGYFSFRRDWVAGRGNVSAMVLMKVSGDSMDPELRDGDMVLIDQAQRDAIPGRMCAVGIDEGVVVKLLDVAPGKLILRSVNPTYTPIEVDLGGDLAEGVRVIGRVIWQCRER